MDVNVTRKYKGKKDSKGNVGSSYNYKGSTTNVQIINKGAEINTNLIVSDETASYQVTFAILLNFIDLIPFIYKCPDPLKINIQDFDYGEAVLTVDVDSYTYGDLLGQFDELTITPSIVGAVLLTGIMLYGSTTVNRTPSFIQYIEVKLGGAELKDGLISGGIVSWIENYDYLVSAATYRYLGAVLVEPSAIVTLNASDVTNPRVDVIALTFGVGFEIITGDAAVDPITPQVDSITQVELTHIDVPANSTEPADVTDELIFDENAEWTPSVVGVTVNFDSTTAPFHGSKCADVGAIGSSDSIVFTAATPVNVADVDTLLVNIKLKAFAVIGNSFYIQFLLGGVAVSDSVKLNYQHSDVTNWQGLIESLSDLTFTSDTLDALKLQWVRGGLGGDYAGFYLDYIKLQKGVSLPVFNDTVILTGDVIASGRLGMQIPTVLKTIITAGSFGDATHAVTVTVDAKGRVTGVTENAIEAGDSFPDTITSETDNTDDGTIHTHRLENIAIESIIAGVTVEYGALYNWYAATDARNIAPVGFHVPTLAEWTTLKTYLGGWEASGTKLKATGTIYWNTPNTYATNETGFDARGAGVRGYDGAFGLTNIVANFYMDGTGGVAMLSVYDGVLAPGDWNSLNKMIGYSLRFIADSGTPTTATGNNGIIYPCVTIGTQTWTAANSNETKYRNGDWIHGFDGGVYTPISDANWAALATEGMCYYADNVANGGGLTPLGTYIDSLLHPPVTVATASAAFGSIDANQELSLVEPTWDALPDQPTIPTVASIAVQALSGTTPTWNVNSGINATLTLSGNTTITLSNLVAGTSGNLTVTNPSTVYTLTFSGYTNKISPSVYSAANVVLTSGGSKIDMYSWYYDGTYLVWNGSQDYK